MAIVVTAYLGFGKQSKTTLATSPAETYNVASIPLGDLAKAGALGIDTAGTLSVNGQLRVNNAFILSPSDKPATSETGQVYFDKASGHLAYYDGADYQALVGSNDAKTTIGGQLGAITLGAGLTLNGTTLSSTVSQAQQQAGVLTLQGQTGAVTLTNGNGIGINGTTITNTGVTSVGGSAGAIGLGTGLGLIGGTISNTGVVTLASSDGSIIVTDNGNGSFNIAAVAGGPSSQAIILAPAGAQIDASTSAAININKTGASGNLLQLSTGTTPVDRFVVDQAGAVITGTIGFNQVTGKPNFVNSVSGTSGALLLGSGLTISGQTIANNGVISVGSISGAVVLGAGLGATGQTISNTGITSIGASTGAITLGSGLGLVGQSLTNAGVTSASGTANQVNVSGATGAITFSLPQSIAAGSSPTFAGLTLTTALSVANGGTGTTTAGGARTNLGAAASGANTDITSLSGLSTALSVAQGGTGIATTPTNGQLLIGNGSGYALSTLSAGSGIQITNAAGSITVTAPSAGSCAACANTALSNLGAVAINTSLLPGTAGSIDLGSGSKAFGQLYLAGTSATPATNNFLITGVSTGGLRSITLPDASGTVAVSATGNIALNTTTGQISFTGQLPLANGGTNATTAAGARTNLGAAASGANSDITAISGLTTALSVAQGGTGTSSLNQNGVLIGNNGGAISSVVAGGAGLCLVSTAGAPSFSACPGSGGVTSVNSGSGAITIAGVTAGSVTTAGSAITIVDATATTKGLASFSGVNFTVTGGAVNTVQGISSSATPTFAGLTLSSALTVGNGGTGATTAAGARTNLGAAASGANSDITSLSATTSINNSSAGLTVGNSAQTLALQGSATSTLAVTASGSSTTVGFASPTANVTYLFQSAAAGTYSICTTVGNCAGAGGGVTTAGGTTNTLAKFTGSQTIGNSLITDNGTTVGIGGILAVNTITPTAALTLGATTQNLTLQGATVALKATSGAFTNSLTFDTPAGSDKTITLPNATGTVAVSASGPISVDANGNISCSTCLTSGGGGSGGVTSFNASTGDVLLQGTSNQIVVSTNTGTSTVTLSLPQDIAVASSPTFSSITANNALTVTNAVTAGSFSTTGSASVGNLSSTGTVTGSTFNALTLTAAPTGFTVAGGTASRTLTVATNVTLNQDLQTTSSVTFGSLSLGTALSVTNGGTGATTAAGARTNLGAAASGTNSDITSITGLTTALTVAQGGTGLTSAATNGQLLIGNGTNYTLSTLTAGTGIQITNASGSITVSAPTAGSCAACANASLSNLGSVAINASLLPGTAGTIDLGSDTKAFGQLYLAGTSATPATNNFLITGISTGGTRTITLPDASGTVAVSATGNIALNTTTGAISFTGQLPIANGGTNATTAAAARTNLGAATSGANSDITSITGLTTALTVAQGGTGTSSLNQNGVLVGNGTSGVSAVVAGAAGLCLVSTAGAPIFDTCPGAGGVTSVNSGSGAITIAGASAGSVSTTGNAITLVDATSTTKGLASFDGTNFTITAGAVNTVQGISTGASPTFAALNLTAALTVSNGGTGATTAAGARTNLGAAASGANSDITSISGLTTALSVAQGGTGIGTVATDGQLLIGNGSGYTLSTLTAGAGIQITNAAGTITVAAPSAGSCATCATTSLNNLSSVALNTSLLPGTAGTINLGSGPKAFGQLYIAGTSATPATNNFLITGVSTGGMRTITLPDASGTVAVSASGNIALDAAGNISFTGQLPIANGGTNSTTAAGARTNLGAAASGANSDITSITGLTTALTVAQGGTGTASLTSNGVVIGNGTSALSVVTAGGAGLCLVSNAGAPSFQSCLGTSGAVNTIGTIDTQTKSANGAVIASNALYLQSADASFPGLVSTGTQTFAGAKTFNGSVTLAAQQTISFVGGTSGQRPGSPTEGQLYFDTTTKQLIIYANGKWQADRNSSTKIVAATNSVNKDAADYIADGDTATAGDGDQVQINQALAAVGTAGGGSVYLMEGTYTVDASVSIPNNVTLSGSGNGTILTIPNSFNAGLDIIVNTDQTTGTKVGVTELRIEGNSTNQTSGNQSGIVFTNMGGGSGSSSRDGTRISNITIRSIRLYGIQLSNSSNSIISNNTIQGTGDQAVYLGNVNHTTITGNLVQGAYSPLFFNGGSNDTVTGNTFQGSTNSGLNINGANHVISSNNISGNGFAITVSGSGHSITGNTITPTGTMAISLSSATNSIVAGNSIQGGSVRGISLGSSNNNSVTGNKIHDAGGSDNNAIYLSASDANTISGNDITDTTCSLTCYAINIFDATSDNNYLSDNRFSVTAGTPSVNDAGTGTIYANQQGVNGNLIVRGSAGIGVNTLSPTTSLQNTGGFSNAALSTPAAPTVTNQGTAGSTSYTYAVTAYDGIGETVASTGTVTATGNATLNSSNYNRITPARVSGAISYKIYRTSSSGTPSSTGLIGTVAGGATNFYFDDTGIAGTTAAPSTNTTGSASIAAFLGINNTVPANRLSVNTISTSNASTAAAQVLIGTGAAGNIGAVIQGFGSQTGDLIQLQDNNGNINAKFGATGAALTLGRIASSGTVIAGSLAFADGTTDNFSGTISSSTLTNNRTYTLPNASGSLCVATSTGTSCASAGTGFIRNDTISQVGNFNIQSAGAGSIGAVIQGAASQTADLFQSQSSDGSILNRIDAAGNIDSVGYVGTPYGGVGQAGNLIVQSEAFDTGSWVKSNVTAPTANTITDPLGSSLAEVLATSASGGSVANSSATAVGATYTFSIWLKTASGTQNVDLRIDGTTSGTGTVKTITASSVWQRYFVTQNTASFAGNVKVLVFPGTTSSSGTVHAWGAQLLPGTTPAVYTSTGSGVLAALNGISTRTLLATGITVLNNGATINNAALTVTTGASAFTGTSTGGVTALSINSGALNNVGLNIKGFAGQASDLLRLQDSTGATTYTKFDATGNETKTTGATTADILNINGDALTSGTGLKVTSTSNAFTTGNLTSFDQTATFGGSNTALSNNVTKISRSLTSNSTAAGAAIDSSSTFFSSASTTSDTWAHTTNNVSNRFLVVGTEVIAGASAVTSVTYNGVALTKIGETIQGSITVDIWVLTNPAVGTYNVVVNHTASSANTYIAETFSGVDQTSPYGTFTGTPYASSSSQSIAPASAVGDTVIDFNYAGVITGSTQGGSQTVINSSINVSRQLYSSYKAGAAGTTTMSWTQASASASISVGVALHAVAAGGGLTVSSDLAALSSNCVLGTGTCSDASSIISLNQQYASATGAVLKVQNAGTGADLQLGNGTIRPTTDSTAAVLFQNAAGTTTVLKLDTTNARVSIGTSGNPAGALSVGGTTGNFNVASTGAVTFAAANSISTNTGALTLQGFAGTTVTTTAGTTSQNLSLTTGNASAGVSGTISLDNGTFTSGTPTITIGGTSARAITIGNNLSATSLTLSGGTTGGINIGAVNSAVTSSVIHVADTNNGTGTQSIAIGSNANSANSATIEAGNGGGINIGTSAAAHTIGLGTGAAIQAVTVGSTNSTSTLVLNGGSGASAIVIGTASTGGINIGTGSGNNTVTVGTNSATTGTQAINIGTNATAGTAVVNVGIGSTIGGTVTLQSTTTTQTVGATGILVRTPSTNQNTAFQVQNSSSAPVFDVDTANGRVGIGNAAPGYTLDVSGAQRLLPSAAPTAAQGVIYFDSTTNKFKCSENGSSFVDCIGAGGGSGVTTVGSLNGGTANATGATISGSNIYLQSASTSFAGLVDTTTQSFTGVKTFTSDTNFSGNITVAASKSLILAGGNTASRPGSPTAGMVYYDTTTNQLIQYNGTKWVSDRATATKIVAASNSSQAIKDTADYVATGTGDESTINTALTAAAGGLVYLSEGTYSVAASISIPNDTTLAGAGTGTIITIPNAQNGTYNIITNTDTSTGTHVTIRDLFIDGNKANQSSGVMRGIYLNIMGGSSGSSARDGAKITNITIRNMYVASGNVGALHLTSSANNTITGNTFQGNGSMGLYMGGGSTSYNTVTGNTFQGNASGIYILVAGTNNTITGNTVQGNTTHGIYIDTTTNTTLTGNSIGGNSNGIYLNSGGSYNAISGNNIYSNSTTGINITNTSNFNTVTSNKIHDNGGSTANNGISVTGADSNSINANDITDTSCSTTCYAISITNSAADNTYLSDNRFSTTSGTVTINDVGTGTIYANQSRAANGGQLANRTVNDTAAFQIQNATGNALFTIDSTNGEVEIGKSGGSGIDGKIVFNNATNANTVTLATGTTSTSYSLTLPTAIGATGDCLKLGTVAGNAAPVTFASCSTGGSTLQGVYDADVDGSDAIITLTAADGGVKIRDTAAGLATTLFGIQNNGGSAKYFDVTASAVSLQDASGNNALVFDSTTSHLKVYEDATSPTRFADIYYDTTNSQAVFAASAGTTRIGSGSGNVAIPLTGATDAFAFTKTYTPSASYSTDEFSITRSLTGAANALTGSVAKVEDLSTGSVSAPTVLLVNQNNASATGFLFRGQKAASNVFTLDTSGTVTLAAGQGYLGAGALTLDSGSGTALNIGTGANAHNTTIGNITGSTAISLQAGTGGITIGQGGVANTISIGNNSGAVTQTINIGSQNNTAGSTTTVNIGGVSANNTYTSTTNIYGDSAINIGSATANNGRTISIGTGYAAGQSINIGTTGPSIVQSIGIGTGGTNATALITIGTGEGSGYTRIYGAADVTLDTSYTGTIKIGDGNAATVQIGQSNVGTAQTINFGNNINPTSVTTINAGSAIGASATTIQAGTGGLTLMPITGNATAFQIQDSTSADFFVVDTQNNRIQIGSTTADATGVILVLDTKNTSGDPAGVNGATYYNSNSGKFRCYENGAWKNCISQWMVINKTADEVINSDATINDDSALFFTTAANTKYHVRLRVFQNAGNASADFKYRLAHTGTTTSVKRSIIFGAGDNAPAYQIPKSAFDAADVALTDTAVGPNTIFEDFIVEVGASGGTLSFQWAQNTSTAASSTTVYAGSYLEYEVVQ